MFEFLFSRSRGEGVGIYLESFFNLNENKISNFHKIVYGKVKNSVYVLWNNSKEILYYNESIIIQRKLDCTSLSPYYFIIAKMTLKRLNVSLIVLQYDIMCLCAKESWNAEKERKQ